MCVIGGGEDDDIIPVASTGRCSAVEGQVGARGVIRPSTSSGHPPSRVFKRRRTTMRRKRRYRVNVIAKIC